MTNNDQDQRIEAMLTRYRPADAPAHLLDRIEQAANWRPARPAPWAALLAVAAEFAIGLLVRGLTLAAALVVLLLLTTGGY